MYIIAYMYFKKTKELSGGLETKGLSNCDSAIIVIYLYNEIQGINSDWIRGVFALEYVKVRVNGRMIIFYFAEWNVA